MPYIPPKARGVLRARISSPLDVGELTYVLYQEALDYLPAQPRFEDYAQVLAALEAAKLEFYRRQVAPYEDTKNELNGDI